MKVLRVIVNLIVTVAIMYALNMIGVIEITRDMEILEMLKLLLWAVPIFIVVTIADIIIHLFVGNGEEEE